VGVLGILTPLLFAPRQRRGVGVTADRDAGEERAGGWRGVAAADAVDITAEGVRLPDRTQLRRHKQLPPPPSTSITQAGVWAGEPLGSGWGEECVGGGGP
jgi:hypothetical protein